MPEQVSPMLATLVNEPPRGDEWLFEVKWDGVRALGFVADEKIRLVSRTGHPCEKQYPELSVAPHYLAAKQAILDGEIAMLDERGVARFELIQPRIMNSDPNTIAHLARSRQVTYFVFDLLYLDGYDLRKTPLEERKRALEQILTPTDVLRYSGHFAGVGEQMLASARELGLEGIMAKRAGSFYEAGRSREWKKVKVAEQQEFLICGYTTGQRDYFSALVLGFYEGGRLRWAGNVGTGFDGKMLEKIFQKLQPLVSPTSPFEQPPEVPNAVWVRPETACTVKFANWTQDRRLRAPVFVGLREDVSPAAVVREQPAVQAERPPLVAGSAAEAFVKVGERRLKFTNLNKVFYPAEGYTKRDVLDYYDAVAGLILPHLQDRPLSLKRYPDGIAGEYFFQKDAPATFASWLRREKIVVEENHKATHFVLAEDRASLLYLANLGCIDQNPWMSRAGRLEHPDFVLIDLDPQECPFERIVEAALLIREKLEQLGLRGYPKTTGGDGMHIYVPVGPDYSYDQTRTFAEILARIVSQERPDLFTLPRSLAKREKGKVYFDYLQNGMGKTIAAPYVLRAYPGAPVATPLDWREVRRGLLPAQFHLRNALDRFAAVGDLFAPVLHAPQKLEGSMERLEEMIRRVHSKRA